MALRFRTASAIAACLAMGLNTTAVSAQTQSGSGAEAQARATLCAESIALAGVEADMDARIQTVVGAVEDKLQSIVVETDPSLRAYQEALNESVVAAKSPILERLQDACVAAFTAQELRDINAFYASTSGRAWLEKGRDLIFPVLEQAVAEAEPAIRDDIERRYCEKLGCTIPPAA